MDSKVDLIPMRQELSAVKVRQASEVIRVDGLDTRIKALEKEVIEQGEFQADFGERISRVVFKLVEERLKELDKRK
jgi:hypothetical protein|tara:strand:+ start:458 stop:685 length:228 start_codon:yes stop_codon:yes gene_type:complete